MKGPSVPIQMESWFNGQCTSRISYFSMIIICWPGKLPTLLLLAFCSPAWWLKANFTSVSTAPLYFLLSYTFPDSHDILLPYASRFCRIKKTFFERKMLPYQTQCWIITQNSLIWIFASPKYSDKMIIFGVKIQIPNLNFAPFHFLFWLLFTKIRPLFNSWLLPKTNQMIFRRN